MARPKGVVEAKPRNTATRKLAAQAADEGITPLEVMLKTMRKRWEADDEDGALAAAEKAAPYVHSKLASTEAKVTANVTTRDGVDRPPRETREEWIARRNRELGLVSAIMGATAGAAE